MNCIKLIVSFVLLLAVPLLCQSISIDPVFLSHLRFRLRDIGDSSEQCAHYWQGIDAKLNGNIEKELQERVSLKEVKIDLLVEVKNMLETQLDSSKSLIQFTDYCIKILRDGPNVSIVKPDLEVPQPPVVSTDSIDAGEEFEKSLSQFLEENAEKAREILALEAKLEETRAKLFNLQSKKMEGSYISQLDALIADKLNSRKLLAEESEKNCKHELIKSSMEKLTGIEAKGLINLKEKRDKCLVDVDNVKKGSSFNAKIDEKCRPELESERKALENSKQQIEVKKNELIDIKKKKSISLSEIENYRKTANAFHDLTVGRFENAWLQGYPLRCENWSTYY